MRHSERTSIGDAADTGNEDDGGSSCSDKDRSRCPREEDGPWQPTSLENGGGDERTDMMLSI